MIYYKDLVVGGARGVAIVEACKGREDCGGQCALGDI